MSSLSDRVVVVTGGSAGLGRATAVLFAQRGAHVAILARDMDRLREAEHEIGQYGGRTLALTVDVADADAVDEAADLIEAELGEIDIWVNNAMTTVFAPVEELSPVEFKRVTDVTYLGVVHGTMAALKRMRRRDRGVIIQVGSALAERSIPLQSAYCGAKHAIRGFTDSLRSELLHQRSRLHVTMVQMPALNTPQFDWCLSRMPRQARPVAPIFEPEVGAEAIVWSATHRRRQLYVGLPTLKAIVANKLFAGMLDRLAARQAWNGQMTNVPQSDAAAANLFVPVRGEHGSHGRFSAQARTRSPELWLAKNRAWLLPLSVAAFGLGVVGYLGARGNGAA